LDNLCRAHFVIAICSLILLPPISLNGLAMRSAVSEALYFHFTTKFHCLHNLSIYAEPRITYEPLLWAGVPSLLFDKSSIVF